jgi:hypothetical protein
MDVATISALAATAAAIGAFSVAGVQLYVGHRQSEAALKAADAALMNAQSAGRHRVADRLKRSILMRWQLQLEQTSS